MAAVRPLALAWGPDLCTRTHSLQPPPPPPPHCAISHNIAPALYTRPKTNSQLAARRRTRVCNVQSCTVHVPLYLRRHHLISEGLVISAAESCSAAGACIPDRLVQRQQPPTAGPFDFEHSACKSQIYDVHDIIADNVLDYKQSPVRPRPMHSLPCRLGN